MSASCRRSIPDPVGRTRPDVLDVYAVDMGRDRGQNGSMDT
jgi:hypothetical protein